MATTSLTVATKSVNEGHEHSQFHLYGSTPDSGTVEQGTGLWWVERGGAQHTRSDASDFVAEGLVWGYCTLEDGDIVHAQYIDAAGNAGAIVTHTCTVSSTWDGTMYVDPTLGNDTTGDGSSGNPYATVQKAITETQSAWVSGDARRILLKKGETHATTGTSALWTLSATYTGHIYFGTYGTGAAPIVNLVYTKQFIGGGFGANSCTIVGLDIRGTGASMPGHTMFNVAGNTSTFANFAVIDCTFSAIDAVAALNGSTDNLAQRDTLDHCAFVRCTWNDYSGAGGVGFIGMVASAYLLFSECSFLVSGGSNHFVRGRLWEYFCFDHCTWNRSGSTGTGNNLRINGGAGSTSDDYAQRGNVYGCKIINATEGFELDDTGNAGNEYFKDIDFNACGADLTTGAGYLLSCSPSSGSWSMQMTRIRARNCWWRGTGTAMFVISNTSAATGSIDSVSIEHCTAFFNSDGGSFSPFAILLSSGGTTGIATGAFTVKNCVGYCSGTGAGGEYIVLTYVGAAAKYNTASDYNTIRKAAGTVRFGSVAGSYETLATWQTSTSADANSTAASTGTSGCTDTASSPPDLRPSSGSWFGAGLGGDRVAYIDNDFLLWDVPPDLGAWQYGGAAPTGPTFGGGGGGGSSTWRQPGLSIGLRLGL